MLEIADKDLIGFFDKLYIGTNSNIKSKKTNENNKKKIGFFMLFFIWY